MRKARGDGGQWHPQGGENNSHSTSKILQYHKIVILEESGDSFFLKGNVSDHKMNTEEEIPPFDVNGI